MMSSISLNAIAQHTLTGVIADSKDKSTLFGVSVTLVSASDTSKLQGSATDLDGNFRIGNIATGDYILKTSYIGYHALRMRLTIDGDKNLGTLSLIPADITIGQVTVEDVQTRVQQKGDTTEYNSNAYKTNPDASTEDLVTKMPGITVENGTVKAHGEDVKKVLVDGQEFFGDDAMLVLKNLPADIVDKIQVYDKLSDEAQATGVDDGNTQKTINIVTKPGKNNGQFGKLYAGYGTDNRYESGGNVNFFKGKRRISLIGISNNINQQNFSNEDLLGALSTAGGSRGGGGGRGGNSGGGRGGYSGGGSSDASNFLVGNQNGITTTNSIGLNYTDKWGKKINVNGSYFFNNADNNNSSNLNRQYFFSDTLNQLYTESNRASNDNFNHRVNARIDYQIDSANSLLLTPRLSLQSNDAFREFLGMTTNNAELLSRTSSTTNTDGNGYNAGGSLLYRHKFEKRGRTFSLRMDASQSERDRTRRLFSTNDYYDGNDSSAVLDQTATSNTNGKTYGAGLTYSEPMGKKGILQINYNPSYTLNTSDARTLSTTPLEYAILDTSLSNSFENIVLTQNAGIRYRVSNKKINFSAGLNAQYLDLSGHQTFPIDQHTDKTFENLLPSAQLKYKIDSVRNISFNYRTQTRTPSVTQLQDVIDNSNPLLLESGNPDLKQEYAQSFVTRYTRTNPKKGRALILFLSGAYSNNYIGNRTILADRDTMLRQNILLARGSQLTLPWNLNGNWSTSTLATYAIPVSKLKSNLNFSAGATYSSTPSLINDERNIANTARMNAGIALTSNISEKIDFNVSYSAYYNTVQNTLQPERNNDYFNHLITVRANWLPWKGLVLGADFSSTYYNAPAADYTSSVYLLNGRIGYKFLKNNAAEIRLTGYDLLNQNKNISRTVTETYVEDNTTNALNRFFMLTFTYNLKRFKSSDSAKPAAGN